MQLGSANVSPMKVVVAGTGGGFVSGISSVADEHARLLKATGHHVVRVVTGHRPRRRPNSVNLENFWAAGSDAVSVARAARAEGADLVWCHTFGVPVLPALRALAVVVAARLAGCPVLVQFHAFGLEQHVKQGGRALHSILRLLGWSAQGIVVLHEAAREAIAPYARSDRLHLLQNWVSMPTDTTPLPPGPPWRVVFVGGLVARKGVPQLIEAVRLLKDEPIALRLVGGAGEEGQVALEMLQERANDLVVDGRVSFAGELDEAGVRDELRRGHLLVLPSASEGSPLAVLEALAEGRPVVVSDAGNLREIVGRSGAGVVLNLPGAQHPEVIAAAIRDILADRVSLEKMAANGVKWVSAHHSVSAVASRVSALLDAVVSGEHRHGE